MRKVFVMKKMLEAIKCSLMNALCIKVASYAQLSFIVGSKLAFFSASSIAMPLVGLMSGVSTALGALIVTASIKYLFFKGALLSYLVYHIPGLCAAAYWHAPGIALRFVVPLVCMIAFMLHPVGSQAWPYALYWLIPLVVYAVSRKNLFLHALAATFIAHAVGSIIWLYTVPMKAVDWLALIPVVACERLLFAGGIVGVYTVLQWAQKIRQNMPTVHTISGEAVD
jgi:hypothetical protein